MVPRTHLGGEAMRIIGWLAAAALAGAASPTWAYENICPYTGQNQQKIAEVLRVETAQVPELAAHFCANVGRKAYNKLGPDSERNTLLGPILGVAWINTGDPITPEGHPLRRAPFSGFMYIIGGGGVSDHEFLRWGTDIVGR